jgi:hypothetical protein
LVFASSLQVRRPTACLILPLTLLGVVPGSFGGKTIVLGDLTLLFGIPAARLALLASVVGWRTRFHADVPIGHD